MLSFLLEMGVGLGDVTSFGAAGLMGAMWLWERRTSRAREQQLDEAHTRIIADRILLDEVIRVVQENAEVMSRLSATQEQLVAELRARGE